MQEEAIVCRFGGREQQSSPGPLYRPSPPPFYQPRAITNGKAVAAMVLGIVWIYWIGSVLALVFGYIARREIDESGGTQSGRGMAVAGIVLGWVGIGFLLLFLLFALLAALVDSL